MKRKVNPTRQELFRLRARLDLAVRGHKLLKDKLEALVKEVLKVVAHYAKLVKQVESELPRVVTQFALASASSPGDAVKGAVFAEATPADVTYERTWYMGVRLPKITPPEEPPAFTYSYVQTGPDLDAAVRAGRDFLPILVELAQTQESLRLLADELERTRRRTNALEYVMIPELTEAKKSVQQKLAELERSDTSRLMKIKEMLEAESAPTG